MEARVTDPWWFYYEQLAGLNPETNPGTPSCGYYLLRRRVTRPNDDPNRRPGDPRGKVTVTHIPVRIWLENGEWIAQMADYFQYVGTDSVDDIFSRCCRNAITKQEYEDRINENQRVN